MNTLSSGGALCPVAALARRINNIRGTSRACPISMVFHHNKQPTRVSDRDITIAVRGTMGSTERQPPRAGLYTRPSIVTQPQGRWSHGSQASSATTDTIMRIGRWTSNTYMTYIHAQIGALAKGLAWRMSSQHTFHNVG